VYAIITSRSAADFDTNFDGDGLYGHDQVAV
jgi:hypothetical protein